MVRRGQEMKESTSKPTGKRYGKVKYRVVMALVLGLGFGGVAHPQFTSTTDWPQWRGPDRTGLSQESGLMDEWPSSGPELVWSTSSLGAGYGSIAIQGDRIFVQMRVGQRSAVASLDRSDGTFVWSRALGATRNSDQGPGPRGTPTVDSDRVYVLTENGDLACLAAEDGTILWQRNILQDFGGRNIPWLLSESPLIDGDKVVVTPGGRGAGVVALDKMSGETIWTSPELSDAPGYASVIGADVQGVWTLMALTDRAGVGIRASDGKLMWSYPRVANRTANAATPIFQEDKVFYSSAYGTGGALLSLTAEGGEVRAEEVYFTRSMQNHHGGLVLVDGYLYGFHNSILTCLEFATGERMCARPQCRKGFHHLCRTAICTYSARTTSWDWWKPTHENIERRGGSRLPIKACPVGRIRS